jgi:zinc protease
MRTINKFLSYSVALVIAVSGIVNAQPKTKSKVSPSSEVIPLDPTVRTGKLPNGFTYYIRKNVEPKNRVTL